MFVATFAVLGLLFFAVAWSRRTAYEPLFTRLDMNDQARIVEHLRDNRISFQLNPAINAVLVPRERVHEVRLSLAGEGLPRGSGRGFEMFDENNIGSSEFDRHVAFIRAVEGELQRTISQMDAVESARVRIVVPRPQLFLERRDPSQASVLLSTRPGVRLAPNQVRAIVFLVSRSVEGLQPDSVTVVDTSGRILSDMVTNDWLMPLDGTDGVTSVQRQLEREMETEFATRIRTMLERVFGVGNVHAVVRAELNFNQRESSLTEFIPDGETGQGIIRSRETEEEDYEGTGGVSRAVPGTTTNIPGYGINQGQNIESRYTRARTTQNMEITTRQTNEVATPGDIRRLTAAVVINREQLTEAELSSVRSITEAALGYYSVRADNIVVNAMAFDDTFTRQLLEELRRERLMRAVAGILIATLMLLFVALVAVWWVRRRRERLALINIKEEVKRIPTIQEMLTSPDLLAFQGEMAVLEEQLKAYARNNPNEVANLVNEWVAAD